MPLSLRNRLIGSMAKIVKLHGMIFCSNEKIRQMNLEMLEAQRKKSATSFGKMPNLTRAHESPNCMCGKIDLCNWAGFFVAL